MPVNERDLAYIWDMIQAARETQAFVKGKRYNDLLTDKMLRLAIERELEIIGETARRVSTGCREEHPEIPWTRIISQRNVIAHEYGDIRLEWMWVVATERVPELIPLLQPLLPPEDE